MNNHTTGVQQPLHAHTYDSCDYLLTVCTKQCSLSFLVNSTPSLMKTEMALRMKDTNRFMWMKFLVQWSFLRWKNMQNSRTSTSLRAQRLTAYCFKYSQRFCPPGQSGIWETFSKRIKTRVNHSHTTTSLNVAYFSDKNHSCIKSMGLLFFNHQKK